VHRDRFWKRGIEGAGKLAQPRCLRSIAEPNGGMQRAQLDGTHPGLSCDLRSAYRMPPRGTRLASGCLYPGASELEFRQEHDDLGSVGVLGKLQRRCRDIGMSLSGFGLRQQCRNQHQPARRKTRQHRCHRIVQCLASRTQCTAGEVSHAHNRFHDCFRLAHTGGQDRVALPHQIGSWQITRGRQCHGLRQPDGKPLGPGVAECRRPKTCVGDAMRFRETPAQR
jgi:hypothetical protein